MFILEITVLGLILIPICAFLNLDHMPRTIS